MSALLTAAGKVGGPDAATIRGSPGARRAVGTVTPELRAAFADLVVAAAHTYEALAVAIIVALMVLKPI